MATIAATAAMMEVQTHRLDDTHVVPASSGGVGEQLTASCLMSTDAEQIRVASSSGARSGTRQ
eukprot:CAMPEP_0198353952 /NCGR_PEP_ID=MMETSP1450-20131203/113465_1 /TAXON_ID=753684 ORGANISM="Madagascaria erythrocladiodes, Strain CCMP3234" /NCGR_SAMPLE_ID=MMETSP1450 /ASSEMBLY_ACC=CAM_ASM_001115 /LENGTH=62 /DNA_ID=CAMNT_0044060161 /DNA_START=26 /DNA_END=211 /DNA_ORIENTATION=-